MFSSIDLKSGYWQVELSEESIPYTAFTVGPLGFFECVRMPFGLTNAPATFQRLMETCLGDMHLNWCIIYLDDVIVFSKDIPSHLERLRGVFTKLREAGLKLKPSKCEFFREKIHYLGHVVSKLGIETDQTKIEAIRGLAKAPDCHRSAKLSGVHKLLPKVHSEICAGGQASESPNCWRYGK